MRLLYGAVAATLFCGSVAQAAPNCDRRTIQGAFGAPVWQAGDAVGFSTPKLEVDADGAPDSYRVDGNGLSYTCDGVNAIVGGRRISHKNDPQNWQRLCNEHWREALRTGDFSKVAIFGFATDARGQPIVQGPGDPLPGQAYLTTTSMTVPGTPDGTQRHYVDANAIPYVVLSGSLVSRFSIKPGDLVAVYRPGAHAGSSGRVAFGIYADCCSLGEASVRMHQDLGNDPIVLRSDVRRAKRGLGERTVTVIFPGRKPEASADLAAWYQSIQTTGAEALRAWGGVERLRACAN
jgi:hypothetical protein